MLVTCPHHHDIVVVYTSVAGPRCPLCKAEAEVEKLHKDIEKLHKRLVTVDIVLEAYGLDPEGKVEEATEV